jgi:hypothetical protein
MRLFGELGTDAAEDGKAAGMGYAVAGDAAFALGGHQSVGAEAHQVLTDRRLRTAEAGGELRDVQWAVFEGLDDAEAVGMGKRPESSGTVTEDLRIKRTRFRHIQKFECFSGKVNGYESMEY